MSKYGYNDRRTDKAQLTVGEAICDAYLMAVMGTRRNVFADATPPPSRPPLPRIVGVGPSDGGADIAVITGEHVRRLLAKKRGFGMAERWLRGLLGLWEGPDAPRVWVWDLDVALPRELIDKLARRIGHGVVCFGPEQRVEVLAAISDKVTDELDPRGSWFLESWKAIRQAGSS